MTTGLKRTRPLWVAAAIFLLNAWICRELFTIGFMRNLDSNEGAFVSMARFFRDFGFLERWFPWFNCGMPIENIYQPLLPVSVALLARLSGWPLEHAFHVFMAAVYCAGPVTLFWFVWDSNKSLAAATAAGVFYSLWSPAQWLIPVLNVDAPLRLFNIVHYAEDPHNVALTLLPVALLFLKRRKSIPAVLFCGAVVLSNAFGAVDLAVGGLCLAIAQRGGWKRLAVTGMVAYCLISPWLPPSLILLMAHDQWGARGLFHQRPFLMAAALLVGVAVVGATRTLQPQTRFAVLFALAMCAIPMAFFLADVTLVPQANRYQLELQLGVSLLFGVRQASAWRFLRKVDRRKRLSYFALAVVSVVAIVHALDDRRAASERIQPIRIAETTQYKTNDWFNRNLPGERAMVAGDAEFLYNLYSNNPQLSGGHEPTVPNWSERVGIYAFYTGAPNPDDAILWLKAFGAHALSAPATDAKFQGHLPLRWTDGGTNIFEVPHRGSSLAHIVPIASLVTRQPIHSLDVEPLRAYVAALENPAFPAALMEGDRIRARIRKDEAISVQINYAPGWKATANGREVSVESDAIGLIAIRPACEGDCEVVLRYGVSPEAWLCRALSLAAGLLLLLCLMLKRSGGDTLARMSVPVWIVNARHRF